MENITIEYGSVFGNFKWNAYAEIDAKLIPVLCALGALQVAQRTPSSAAEKELAGYDKRPVGFKRDSIPYSDDNADTLGSYFREMKVEIGRDEKDAPIFAVVNAEVTTAKYEGSTTDVVMKEERAAYARNAKGEGKFKSLEALAVEVGYDGELGDGTAENAPVAFIRAIKDYSKRL